MPATYEPIATYTVTGTPSTITFSDIAGTWTDLVIVSHLQLSGAQNTGIRFNSDSGNNYSRTWLSGNGSSASSIGTTNNDGINIDSAANGNGTTYATVTATIMSYANTNVYKTVLTAAATAGTGVARQVGLWRSTSAITAVAFIARESTTFTAGTVSLYGIKAA